MADFVQKTVNKTAIRDLATPIATVTSFTTVIEDNPFGRVRNREHGPDLTGVNTPCGPSRSSRSSRF